MINHDSFKDSSILVIDDQRTITLILKKTLTESGFHNVTCINDPRDAMKTFEEVKPDLILQDLAMPHINGFELLKMFREKESIIPIIVLTSEQDPESKYNALSLGANDFLRKPFDKAELLARIHNNLAIRHQHKILEQKVAERTKELQETQIEVIHRLIKASEYRDSDTGDHIIRMSILCEELAKAVGFSDREAQILRYASTMHDVGKIGIPDDILLKPGKLSDEEFRVMKEHTLIGAEILKESRSRLLQMAENIVLTHHERWDGSGYPNGLKGEEIPLEGRITAICDVFDALTSSRPYKEPWPLDKVIAEIENQKGKHFDPDVADKFLDILPSVLERHQIFSHVKGTQQA
ncbi:MAG: response regulator [Bacillaceae bacterium]|nr:response regulator [Bacillaceae bacterium]